MRNSFVIKNLILSAILFVGPVMAYETGSENYIVYLKMDKLKYFSGEDVKLSMYIKNRSNSNISFSIYDRNKNNLPEYLTFQPVVFDMRGREEEIIVPYRLEHSAIDDVIKKMNKRKVELGPGEIIIHSIDLNRIYNLKKDKKYRIKGYFFTDFPSKKGIMSNNILSFIVTGEKKEPAVYYPERIVHEVSPSEAVTLALNSEKERNWKRMLKYFNIEKYIRSFPDFVRLYDSAMKAEKKIVANRFVDFITRQRDDYILDYRIKMSEKEDNESIAYVDAVVDRFAPRKTDRYMYRFTLEKFRNLWLIVGLEATVMRGIRR